MVSRTRVVQTLSFVAGISLSAVEAPFSPFDADCTGCQPEVPTVVMNHPYPPAQCSLTYSDGGSQPGECVPHAAEPQFCVPEDGTGCQIKIRHTCDACQSVIAVMWIGGVPGMYQGVPYSGPCVPTPGTVVSLGQLDCGTIVGGDRCVNIDFVAVWSLNPVLYTVESRLVCCSKCDP
ncbi:MAG: hypothetical protein IT457_09725 [Planctomycetes bacterium]|nr:hypothetical protein [Planctomycetota bacterium]